MMTKHDVAHYVIGGCALLTAIGGGVLADKDWNKPPVAVVHDASAGFGFQEASPAAKPRPDQWPGLGQDKTIALGEALQKLGAKKIVVFCASPKCRDLEADLDDAFQIAQWDDDQESAVIIDPKEEGLLVGPASPPGTVLIPDELATALQAEGFPVKMVPMNVGFNDVGLIIAKRPKP